MKNLASCALGLSMLIGCGTDHQTIDTLPDLTVPPVPTNGLQVITPIFENIQPGMDYEVCTWTDQIVTQQTDVRAVTGYQNEPPGHHVIVFYTLEKQPPGTQRVCNDSDMATFRFVAGGASNGELNEAPGNLVYRLPAGAQIVINHHYLNSGDTVLRGQSVVNLNFAEPGTNYTPSGYLSVLNSALTVAQGDTSQDMHAVLDRTYKLWQFLPHMHQWGKHTVVTVNHGDTSTTEFDLDWDPSYAFHPPMKKLDPATPMILNAGDSIDVHCEWNNNSGRDLAFGFEMCVAFGATVDDTNQGNWDWDNGQWGTF